MNNLNKIARISGIGYLVIFITGFFSNFFVLETLVDYNDTAATVNNILNNEFIFRLGIVGFIIMILIDLLLAWTFFLLFEKVNKKISLFSSWFRIVHVIIFGVAISYLINILSVIKSSQIILEYQQLEVISSILTFNNMWLVGLIFFGFYLLLIGYLLIKSGYVSKILGVLVILAGSSYLLDSGAQILFNNYDMYKDMFSSIVVLVAVLGELSLSIWLIVKSKVFSKLKTN